MRVTFFIASAAAWLLFAGCDSSSSGGPASGNDAGAQADGASTTDGGGNGGDASSPGDASVDGSSDAATGDAASDAGAMALTSTAFADGGIIPVVHSVCDGDNESIPLAWSGAPAGAMSFAVVMRDLTLGGSSNYHWVLYDLPSSVTSLAQDLPKDLAPDPPGGGAKQTRWSFGSDTGYQGMCPIVGPTTHTYELAVYALDVATLPAPTDPADPAQVDAAIQAHEIGHGKLRGDYTKK